MSDKLNDTLLNGAIGLAAVAGILAAGALFTRPKRPEQKEPSPQPRSDTTPVVIAPHSGVITKRELHAVQSALRDRRGPVDLVVHALGGYVSAVDPIVHALVAYSGPVTVYVPYMAFSGGTMIALAANKIVMGKFAVLGPVDPQIMGVAASDFQSLLATKSTDEIDDSTHLLASLASKCDSQTRELVRDLVPSEEALEVLTSGRLSHSTGITPAAAARIGLPVEVGVPAAYYHEIDRRVKRPNIVLWDLLE